MSFHHLATPLLCLFFSVVVHILLLFYWLTPLTVNGPVMKMATSRELEVTGMKLELFPARTKAPVQVKVPRPQVARTATGTSGGPTEIASPQAAAASSQPQMTKTALNRYLAQVHRTIEGVKYYPRWARKYHHQGVVHAVFTLNGQGLVAQIRELTGEYRTLIEAVTEMISKRAVFPPFPPELQEMTTLEIAVPIHFSTPSI